MFPRDGKTAPNRKDIWEIGTKWFPLAMKPVSNSQNKGFTVKINLHWAEESFSYQEYLKNGKEMVSSSQNEGFVSKMHFEYLKNR